MLSKLLNYQSERGLFPTIGKKGNSNRELNSIYLHSFVLEYLIDNHAKNCPNEIQKGLDFILSQAVKEDGQIVWRWLKEHPTPEDYRPTDTDDTARARLVIEKALRKGFRVPKKFREFDYKNFFLPLMTKEGAIKTYTRNRSSQICPEVNANILYNLVHTNCNSQLKKRITNYLGGVLESDYLTKENFEEGSKYFLSPYFLLYILSKINSIEPKLFPKRANQRIIDITKSLTHRNKLDNVWCSTILRNYSLDSSPEGLSFEETPIFQAKSLREKYSCPSATAVFCLETQ